ncbi:LmbU family transcriptional regulator [Actinoplanes sp. NPDC026619]|uniref:LmbU family transcriptional regulator n=1 Tax=Actinoplanes sp. NPDC026619 TaxID=3155798 RepID=UPI0033CA73EB
MFEGVRPPALPHPAATGLELPEGFPFDAWLKVGRQLRVIADATAWWLGDWLVYGEDSYPDRYRQAAEETALHYQTLRNYAWVARRYPPHRRRGRLSFQHHAELCRLGQAEQDRWLDRAEHFGWSRNELRRQLRGRQSAEVSPPGPTEEVRPGGRDGRRLRVSAEQERLWRQAAALAGDDLDDWMRQVIGHAADAAMAAGRDDQPAPPA